MLSNAQARNRIDAINELVANHKADQERSQFKVTPYDVVKKGFIPDVYSREFDQLMDNSAKLGEGNESPLTLPEELSYATYFAIHPDKVCGVMEVSTSGAFPIRVRGTRADVERVIGETLKGKSVSFQIDDVEIDDSMKGFIYISFVVETDGKNSPHSLSFTLDEDNRLTIGVDSYPNWRMMYVSAENGWVERPNYEKDKIRKYLDNSQIEEILKDYYPKVVANPKLEPDSLMLNEKSVKLHNVKLSTSLKGFLKVSFLVKIANDNYPMVISFRLDKNNKLVIGKDYCPIWHEIYEKTANGWGNCTDDFDKDIIRQYLFNPQIQEILKDYYPKVAISPNLELDSPLPIEKSVKFYNLKFIKNTDETIVHFSFESEEPNALVEMRIELDDNSCMKYLAETDTKFFQYRSVQVKEYSNFSNVVRINKSPVEIKQYLDNPQIKEFLKDYYPKEKLNSISDLEIVSKEKEHIKISFKSGNKTVSMACKINEDTGILSVFTEKGDFVYRYVGIHESEEGGYAHPLFDGFKIHQYLDNPQIKEFLKDYYPKPKTLENSKKKNFLNDFKVEQRSESFFDFSFFDNQFGIKLYMTVLFMPDGTVNYQPYMLEHRNGKGYEAGDSFRTVNEETIPYYLEKDEIKQFLKPVLEKVQSNRKRQRRIRVATATAIALALAYNYKND